MNLLNWTIALPALGFVLLLLMPAGLKDKAKFVALILSLVIFAMSLGLITRNVRIIGKHMSKLAIAEAANIEAPLT